MRKFAQWRYRFPGIYLAQGGLWGMKDENSLCSGFTALGYIGVYRGVEKTTSLFGLGFREAFRE